MYVCIYIYTHTHTHTHTMEYTMEYYSAIKKDDILPFASSWMNLENIMLSEISLTEEDKYCMISLICGILKNNTNECIYKTERDSQT